MIFIATYKRKLKDRSGNYVVPATRASCVYFDDNTTLSKLTFYPVGSIYQSVNETSPASLFGGDWERQYDRFLIGGGNAYEMGEKGGESVHTLTISEMPRHMHGSANSQEIWTNPGIYETSSEFSLWTTSSPAYKLDKCQGTAYTGGGNSHNNMPPYRAIAMWIRTA